MNSPRATKKQQALLEFVDVFIKQHHYGPSYREIMNALSYKSVSTVAVHVEGLIAKGFLSRKDNNARSLEVVGREYTSAKRAASTTVAEVKRKFSEDLSQEDKACLLTSLKLLGYEKEADELTEIHLA